MNTNEHFNEKIVINNFGIQTFLYQNRPERF